MIIIQTSKGRETMIDNEDYDLVSKHSWYDVKGYACTQIMIEEGKYKQIPKHRFIINVPEGKYVDHINGNRSDNRKENLRIVTAQQNSWNAGKKSKETSTSQYKGVVLNTYGRYQIRITHDGKSERLGSFDSEIAAANAFNYYVKKFFGEYARLNDVPYMSKEEWEKHQLKKSSEFKGVSWAKDRNKWSVYTYDPIKRKQKIVGYFEDEIIAANYYNHLIGKTVNECEYASLEDCEKRKHKRRSTK